MRFADRRCVIAFVCVLCCLPACGDSGSGGAGGESATLAVGAGSGSQTSSGKGASSATNGSAGNASATTSATAASTGAPASSSVGQGDGFYMTEFPNDENPISEGGAWSSISSPWLSIRTVGGIAKPDDYVTNYNDNYAMLSGFGPDYEITAQVYIGGAAPYGELLLLGRMAETADTLRGYEFLYDGDGNVQLMRWNGFEGDFTAIGGESANPGPLQDNDELRMRIEGNTITVFHRRPPEAWQQIGQTVDDTFPDGQPGMGFFVRPLGQTIDDVGFRRYEVVALP